MSESRLTKIGKYQVECVIGEGAMGVVYRAVDPVLNRRVAIKVMSDAVAQNAALRERFLREAQAAGSLQHPNVVTIYDFGDVEGHLYIAMEYVDGDDLSDLLSRHVEIPIAAKLEIVMGVLNGLAFAHKRGIVHRDIKPANIRVDVEGKARLMDFGVAHLASSEMTITGEQVGTPSFMAPEQILASAVSPETDIFALGAVLFEMLTGKRPFEGDTLQSVMYQVLNVTPPAVETLVAGMPPGLSRVVMRALEKEPRHRYRSALEMASDLATILDALDPVGRRSSLSLRATIDSGLASERDHRRRRSRRKRGALLATSVLAVAVAVVSARELWRTGQPASSSVATVTSASAPIQAGSSERAAAGARPDPAPAPPSPRQAPSITAQRAAGGSHRRDTARGRVPDRGAAALPDTPREPSAPRALPSSIELPPTVAPQQSGVPIVAPPAAAPARESPENPAADIAAVIAAYGRALESRDIAELRRVYPAMTPDQAGAFEQLFALTRSLRAPLSVTALRVDGPGADAQVVGTYEYVTTRGVVEKRPVSFRATLRRDSGAWTLTAVR